jgi:hypothetical protein
MPEVASSITIKILSHLFYSIQSIMGPHSLYSSQEYHEEIEQLLVVQEEVISQPVKILSPWLAFG